MAADNRKCSEVHFTSFVSGGFITTIVVNPPERKLAKGTFVHCRSLNILENHVIVNKKIESITS